MNPPAAASAETERPRPSSAWELFWTFALLSLQSFGGALALIERTVVRKKRWLEAQEFVELFGLSQVLPGPSGCCFCVMLGDRFLGVRGAFASLAGFLVVPSVVVIAITAVYQHYADLPAVSGALHGMGAASVGLIMVTATRMARTLRGRRIPIAIAAVTFIGVGLLHQPLGRVMLSVGAVSIALAWWKKLG
jgi:chromate transporter